MLRFTVRGLSAALFALALTPLAAAQSSQPDTQITAPQVLLAPPALLQQFDVTAGTLQSLVVPNGHPATADVDVVLAGSPFRLSLAQFEVRAPGFQLLENGPAGLQVMPTPACVTYRGFLVGDAGSEVAATILGGSVTAFVRTGMGELWIVQPVQPVQPMAGAGLHIVFRGVDSAVLPMQCGTVVPNMPAPPVIQEDAVYVCDIAIEADYPFFQQNGSNTTSTQNDVTGIVNAMSVIYERDVQVRLQISQLIVNSTPDPYSSSIANTLLSQFQSRWNAVYGNVPRDVAHLFTGRNMGAASGGIIGIAYLSTVCYLPTAYGVSQSRFSNNYGYRVGVTAHELGHNFGAGHCNSAPPCNIMCSGIGGCSNNVSSFGATAQNQIIGYRQSVGCLPLQLTAPVISSVQPVSHHTIAPDLVTLTGTGFSGTTQVNVGSTWVTNGIQVLSDTQMRFTPPAGLPLGVQTMSVTNPIGPSNNTALFYTAANPCALVVQTAVLGGTSCNWTMGGWNGDFSFLVVSLVATTSPWLGWPLVDGPVVLWQGGLDARGMASYSFPVPAGVLSGLRVYSQMIDIIGSNLTVRSLSSVRSTLVVL